MADGEPDELGLTEEARLEISNKPEVKRGLASLRGTKRSTYLRRSVLRILAMAPEEREALSPRNGFEEIAKALIDAPKKGKEGSIAIAAFREIRDVMGERIGSRWRDTVERNSDKAAIVVDIPHAKPEPDLPN